MVSRNERLALRSRNVPRLGRIQCAIYLACPEHVDAGTRREHIVLFFQRAVSVLIQDANVTEAENPLTGISTWWLGDFTAHKM
jgi:hypothetical protein